MATLDIIFKRIFADSRNVNLPQSFPAANKNPECKPHSFVEEYTYRACIPEVRQQVLKMAVDCTGTRMTGRIPGISKDTVTAILKRRLEPEGKLRFWGIGRNNGSPLTYRFGTREHKHLDELCTLLAQFNIKIVYADDNFAYKNHIKKSKVITGKKNTQKIERKHLSLRTWCSRLTRKSIRFSKSFLMHKIVVGLVINYWFFGRNLPFHLI